jgi:pimeloyl-ACP methyl ester carboxylesterase
VTLLVHGIATNACRWRHVIGAAAGRRRGIALDLPPHGRSPVTAGQDLSVAAPAAAVESFCEAPGLTGIDLVATDTGGAVARELAPDAVTMPGDLDAAAEVSFGMSHEPLDRVDRGVSWAYRVRDTIPGGDRRWRRAALPGRTPDGSRSAPGTALGHGRAGPGPGGQGRCC